MKTTNLLKTATLKSYVNSVLQVFLSSGIIAVPQLLPVHACTSCQQNNNYLKIMIDI